MANQQAQTSQTSGDEGVEITGTVQEEESHLSETARFVLPFLRRITQHFRNTSSDEDTLLVRANEIIRLLMEGKITPEDEKVIDFILDCGEQKDELIIELIKENAGTKAEAVIRNYFSKFLNKEIKQID